MSVSSFCNKKAPLNRGADVYEVLCPFEGATEPVGFLIALLD